MRARWLAVCSLPGSASVTATSQRPTLPPALRFITHHPFYAGVHLGAIVGVLAWVGGFVALAGTLKHGAGNVFGRLGAASALVGAAIFIVDFSIDGVAGQGLAEAWAAASPSDQADVELAAQTAFTILRGTSLTSIIISCGDCLSCCWAVP